MLVHHVVLFLALKPLCTNNNAKMIYNFTSTQPNGLDLTQIGTGDVPINVEDHEDVRAFGRP
jgi:hypothetical protein